MSVHENIKLEVSSLMTSDKDLVCVYSFFPTLHI